jgi:putative FmdB family regulatory protein
MPIYEYACPDCGHLNDHLQKLADAPIAVCPSCGSHKYYKKISAAGFALKGTGWYVTDFRNGSGGKPADKKEGDGTVVPPAAAAGGDAKAADATASKSASPSDSAKAPSPSAAPSTSSSPAPAPAPAPAPSPASAAK